MKVVYIKPSANLFFKQWKDDSGIYDIWYKNETEITNYKKMDDLPLELVSFLDKWTNKINEYKETYREEYPIKMAKIEFIYKEVVYRIVPTTINAVYQTDFMSDSFYDISWDSLFEKYEKEIREDLKKELGVIHSRYFGYLD